MSTEGKAVVDRRIGPITLQIVEEEPFEAVEFLGSEEMQEEKEG